MKIAVMTLYREDNYGTVLQAAAMCMLLRKLGHDADVIQYRPMDKVDALPKGSLRPEFLEKVREDLHELRNPLITGRISGCGFEAFRDTYLSYTPVCRTLTDLENLNGIYDAFICGSDRVWFAPQFDPHMFLDFVTDPEQMIAYAPCLMKEGIEERSLKKKMGELISRFSHLSVREKCGRELLSEFYGIQTEEVADPVLMLQTEEWEELWRMMQLQIEAAAAQREKEEAALAEASGEPPVTLAGADEDALAEAEEMDLADGTEDEAEDHEEPSAEAEETAAEAEETAAADGAKDHEEELSGKAEESIPAEHSDEKGTEELVPSNPENTDLAAVQEEDYPKPRGYLLICLMSGNSAYWDAAYKLADRLELDVKAIPFFENDLYKYGVLKDEIDPIHFARLFYEADYICTDSYHGLLLGISFQKELCCFRRYPEGQHDNRNIRMTHILDAVGMMNRLYEDNAPLEQYLTQTDFIPVKYKVDALRLKSHRFLEESLQEIDAHNHSSVRPNPHVREKGTLCCGCGACAIVCPEKCITIRLQENGFLEAVVDDDVCSRCGTCMDVCPMQGEVEGRMLTDASLLSYSDEDREALAHSDSGAFGWRLAKLAVENGETVAGCVFDPNSSSARHILVRTETKPVPVKNETSLVQTETPEPETEDKGTEAPKPDAAEPEVVETEDKGTETPKPDAAEAETADTEEKGTEAPKPDTAEAEGAETEEKETEAPKPETEEAEASEEAEAENEASSALFESPAEALKAMQGSIFLQSNISGIWKELRKCEEEVLLIGTPCQIAAARKLLAGKENITYVDFICSGLPSKLLFEKYAPASRGRIMLLPDRLSIRFRGKTDNRRRRMMVISDGARGRSVPHQKDGFIRVLHRGNCLSKSCYECRWRDRSCADLRLGTADASSVGWRSDKRRLWEMINAKALSAGTNGYGLHDVTAVFCMTDKGRMAVNRLMTQGYWEGLHKQTLEDYLRAVVMENQPCPVYYEDLIRDLKDSRFSMRRILADYVKPFEKRERAKDRLQRFTREGRAQLRERRKLEEQRRQKRYGKLAEFLERLSLW